MDCENIITVKEDSIVKCVNCGSEVLNYEPEYCCNGDECGCMGLPIEPPVCVECEQKIFKQLKQLKQLK